MGKRQATICKPNEKYNADDFNRIQAHQKRLLSDSRKLDTDYDVTIAGIEIKMAELQKEISNAQAVLFSERAKINTELGELEKTSKKYRRHNLLCEGQEKISKMTLSDGCILIEVETEVNHRLKSYFYSDKNELEYLSKGWYFFNFLSENKENDGDLLNSPIIRYFDLKPISNDDADIFTPDSCKKIVAALSAKYKNNIPEKIVDSWLFQYIIGNTTYR